MLILPSPTCQCECWAHIQKKAFSLHPSLLAAASFQPQPAHPGRGRRASSTGPQASISHARFWQPRATEEYQTLTSPCPKRRSDLTFELKHTHTPHKALNCNCNISAMADGILTIFEAQLKSHFLHKVSPDSCLQSFLLVLPILLSLLVNS